MGDRSMSQKRGRLRDRLSDDRNAQDLFKELGNPGSTLDTRQLLLAQKFNSFIRTVIKLLCSKILSNDLDNFQIMLVGGQDL